VVQTREQDAGTRRIGVQVIARAAQLLRELASVSDGLTTLELAERLDLPKPTVYRIARALIDEDFIRPLPLGKLSIGPAFIVIAGSIQRDLRQDMRPFLEGLSRELNERVDLAVLEGGDALFIDRYGTARGVHIASHVGARLPLHCTASGKALLAELSPAEVEATLQEPLQGLTPNSITDLRRLAADLEQVRATGVAYDREEFAIGVAAVSTSVRDAEDSVVAIAVQAPIARFQTHEGKIVATLLRCRAEAQRALLGKAAQQRRSPSR
jgi:IclR family acetate operon transcriptional repressor